MAAVWHTLTWHPEHRATLQGYKVALHLTDMVTGDGRGDFFLQKLVRGFTRNSYKFRVNLKFPQTNFKVTSK